MKYSSFIWLLCAAASCRPGPEQKATQTSADSAADSHATPAAASADAGSWRVTSRGAGTARIGMTLAELSPQLVAAVDTASIGDGCAYVSVRGAPAGMSFMIEGRRLVRIEVKEGSTPTLEGARIGDSEERILQLYPGARREPHKYTDGYYLIAVPVSPADSLYRYVFETDGRRVTMYHAGVYPPVQYVEGCS